MNTGAGRRAGQVGRCNCGALCVEDAEARLWYQRAAESRQDGFQHTLRGLGVMLVSGEAGPADLARGITYLRIAAAGGDGNARDLLDRLDDRITPDVAREASRISEQWLAEHLPAE